MSSVGGPLTGFSHQGLVEKGNFVGRSLVLVESELRAPEEEALEAHQSHANVSRY